MQNRLALAGLFAAALAGACDGDPLEKACGVDAVARDGRRIRVFRHEKIVLERVSLDIEYAVNYTPGVDQQYCKLVRSQLVASGDASSPFVQLCTQFDKLWDARDKARVERLRPEVETQAPAPCGM